MKDDMKKHNSLLLAVWISVAALTGCKHVDDPFVDRVAAPVLVLVEGAPDGGGLTAEPVVSQKIGTPVTVSVRIFDLDKSGLLNHAVGIDSIPVTALTVKLAKRDGTALADLTTDGSGRVSLTKTWAELGIATPVRGSSVALTWSGSYKGQAFSRLSRVQGVD